MEFERITSLLKEFLERKFPREDAVLEPDTDLLDDWFIDSLGIVETVMFIESEFDIALRRADINATNFRDLTSLSAFVAGRLKA